MESLFLDKLFLMAWTRRIENASQKSKFLIFMENIWMCLCINGVPGDAKYAFIKLIDIKKFN